MIKSKIFLFILSLVPLVILLFVLPNIDDSIPTHFNANFEVTTYGSKYLLFIPSLLPLTMAIFFIVYESYSSTNLKLLNIFSFVIVTFMIIVDIWVLLLVLNPNFNSFTILFISFSLLFILFGNYSNKIEYNHTFGFRTPATLKSKTVWNKTHRRAGYIFFSMGIVLLLLTVTLYNYQIVLLWLFVIMLFSSIIYLSVYAHILYKNELQHTL